MKHHIAVFVMVCLLVGLSVFPAAAQDEVFIPEPCTADEVTQLTDTALQWGDQMNTISQKAYDQTADGNIEKLLDWGDLYVSFFYDIYPTLPGCIDGVMYGDAVGLMLNRQMTLETLIVLNDFENTMSSTDADLNQAVTDVFQIQSDFAAQGVTAVNAHVTQLQTGEGVPGWAPACTADQLEFTTQLDAVEEAYSIILPFLQTYLDEGTVETNIHVASMNIVTALDAGINNLAGLCADYYVRLINDVYLYGDTLSTLTLARIAPYMSENVNAERFDALLQFYNDGLYSYVTDATATADS